jgi:5'(3')-deoxyribonucleotidase
MAEMITKNGILGDVEEWKKRIDRYCSLLNPQTITDEQWKMFEDILYGKEQNMKYEEAIDQVTENVFIKAKLLRGCPPYEHDFAACNTDEERIAVTEKYVNMFFDENLNDREIDGAANKRLFVDMDGTLAEFNPTKKLEDLYEEGYFRELKPYQTVVDAIKYIIQNNPDIEVFVLSAYLTDSEFALNEKKEWLDQHLPELDTEHRLFCACGSDKGDIVPGGIRHTDRLLDDYTHNLMLWSPPGIGLKLLNGINDTHKTWKGARINKEQTANELAAEIIKDFDKDIPFIEGEVEL